MQKSSNSNELQPETPAMLRAGSAQVPVVVEDLPRYPTCYVDRGCWTADAVQQTTILEVSIMTQEEIQQIAEIAGAAASAATAPIVQRIEAIEQAKPAKKGAKKEDVNLAAAPVVDGAVERVVILDIPKGQSAQLIAVRTAIKTEFARQFAFVKGMNVWVVMTNSIARVENVVTATGARFTRTGTSRASIAA